MSERCNERCARHIVATALGVPVDRFEDGTAPSQVDAVIKYPGGVVGWLEVIGDHDSDLLKQWDALKKCKHRLCVPGLRLPWVVWLRREARIQRVIKKLPTILLQLQGDQDRDETIRTPELDALGVESAQPLVNSDQSGGVVLLLDEGWSGTHGSEDRLGQWVTDVLTKQDDVPRKLAACPEGERHVFLWATIGSDYAIQHTLENRDDAVLPRVAPILPEAVTHVWVAGRMSSQGVLAWFPDRGWWRA